MNLTLKNESNLYYQAANLTDMKRNYKITKDDEFLKSSYPISYKLLICYDLMKLISQENYADIEKEIKKILNNLSLSIKEQNPLYIKSFLEVLTAQSHKGKSLVIVDRNDACYPLVLYPEDDNPDHGDRIPAFEAALNAVIKNISAILPILISCSKKGWDNTVQDQILKIIPEPSRSKNKPTF